VRYSGYTCFRGIAKRPASIEPGYAGEWWGAGQHVGITTLLDDRIYWWATFNAPANQQFNAPAAEVRRRYADWAALLHSPPDGCMAIEDAVELPRYFDTRTSISDALTRFTQHRYPRTATITNESWRMGRVGNDGANETSWPQHIYQKRKVPSRYTRGQRKSFSLTVDSPIRPKH
jgi:hypothetical protein